MLIAIYNSDVKCDQYWTHGVKGNYSENKYVYLQRVFEHALDNDPRKDWGPRQSCMEYKRWQKPSFIKLFSRVTKGLLESRKLKSSSYYTLNQRRTPYWDDGFIMDLL